MNDRIRKKTKVAVAIADRKNPLPKCEKLALPTLRANPKYPVYRKINSLCGLGLVQSQRRSVVNGRVSIGSIKAHVRLKSNISYLTSHVGPSPDSAVCLSAHAVRGVASAGI